MQTTIFAFLAIAMIIAAQKVNYFSAVRSVLSVVVAPIQYLVDWPIEMSDWLASNMASHNELIMENAHLRTQQFLLRVKLQKLLALQQENTQLRALLQSSAQLSGRVLVAQLLSVAIDPLVAEIILDKGSRKGVYVNQPVLDANGIIGQVIQVGPLTSRVLLINDTRSAVPVQDSRSGYRALAVGNGNSGTLSLANVPATNDMIIGDLLVSSGLGGRYPEGYPVGVIAKIIHNPGETFATIIVRPSAQLNRSRLVLLLWPSPNSVDN